MDQPPVPETILTPESRPKILSFEEFSYRGSDGKRPPRYENFYSYFCDGLSGEAYRTNVNYLKFAKENSVLNQLLRSKVPTCIKDMFSRSEDLKIVDRELYEAYKIMRGYGVSDTDFFS